MAANAVAASEVPFEVGAPDVIRLLRMLERVGARRHPQPRPTRPDKAMALENLTNRARGRNDEISFMQRLQSCPQLLRAVERVLLS
jgi:hypothetical protein